MLIQENVQLAPYTNFKVGGPAKFFVEAKSTDDVREALGFAKSKNIPAAVLGGGTNVLVSDRGFAGLVIKLAMKKILVDEQTLVADAGCTMGQVVAEALKNGLVGLEWAAGLPGTVGGAVAGNSGCYGGETKDVVGSVALINPKNHELRITNYEDLYPQYRHTLLEDTGEIVLAATFRLKKGDAKEIETVAAAIKAKASERIKEQPLGTRTAGSTFKGVKLSPDQESRITNNGLNWKEGMNRAGFLSAGWLLEKAGLKGFKIGGASFSPHHANFIVNDDKAAAQDIYSLIKSAKEKVKELFGIELEEEIRYIGFE
jgi:UDP-N-acetylmuramate dehydrogenase